ncbi:hypothetical protein P3T76_009006 [Phytophthora citrophthora]|uniref:Necrosis inducing-like protein NPP1 type n=1 Tax=Phytophthora citrophthora TaxID=4793 RepID=A0AAD9LJU7_9STRA|nr:hypothetical protein P3T76_009006 [Phytophthora citrophthora]
MVTVGKHYFPSSAARVITPATPCAAFPHFFFHRLRDESTTSCCDVFVTLAGSSAAIDHDKVEPFPQLDITVSEKAAIKFQPQLYTARDGRLCVPFPAVNAAGEITGGLKGTNGNDGCKYALKGAQVHGRAGWYKDLWAIMYSWFNWLGFPSRRHDWKDVVVWIDNPALEMPNIIGISMSTSDTKYYKQRQMDVSNFVGSQLEVTRHYRQYIRSYTQGSSTNLRFENEAGDLSFAPAMANTKA